MTGQSSLLSAAARLASQTGITRGAATRNLARVAVYENMADAQSAWSELEAIAPATAYQTYRWLASWIETVGRAKGICPTIVVCYGADDRPVALFPFGIVQQGKVRLATFLGGRDSNLNLGLIRPHVQFERSDVETLLHSAAGKARLKPDAFVLVNQPRNWDGVANPLAQLPHQRSPSECYSATLGANGADFVNERLSGEARRKLFSKRKRLSEMGAVAHIVAKTPDDVARIVDAFFAQKLERFRQKNVSSDFDAPESRQFLMRACLEDLAGGTPTIELHALVSGNRIVAVYAGTPHRDRFFAMINSFDLDPDIARTSPADLLLMSMMQTMCGCGYKAFNLGIGEARYKSTWCDRAEPLIHVLYGITLKGHAYVLAESAWLKMKRYVKQNDWAWNTVQKLRQQLYR